MAADDALEKITERSDVEGSWRRPMSSQANEDKISHSHNFSFFETTAHIILFQPMCQSGIQEVLLM